MTIDMRHQADIDLLRSMLGAGAENEAALDAFLRAAGMASDGAAPALPSPADDAGTFPSDQFEASLFWLHDEPGLVGRGYDIVLARQTAQASITSIKHRIEPQTGAPQPAKVLARRDIGVCTLALDQPLRIAPYAQSPAFGGFVLRDRGTGAPVACGLIRHTLRRAHNVHQQLLSITQGHREQLHGHPATVVWLTGLSGAGKSTIANALEVALHRLHIQTYLLDGDNVRLGLNRDLGFTNADRVENVRRLTEVARLMLDAGLVVICAAISPFEREREAARDRIGAARFVEVFIDTPLATCEARDAKGLYGKARAGQIPNFTGINSPYEAPTAPDVQIDGGAVATADAVEMLVRCLQTRWEAL